MKKRFYVKIDLELHAITCPGVWLCTSGYIEVTIKTLGYVFKTGPLEPKFPLLCHELFTIEGYYTSVNTISELEKCIGLEDIEISLWQNGRRLSYFNGKLGQIMRNPSISSSFKNFHLQILMTPSHSFPGIIAPKVDLTTRAIAHDQNLSRNQYNKMTNTNIFPWCFQEFSKTSDEMNFIKEFRRQKPVCHIKKHDDLLPEVLRKTHEICKYVVPWGCKYSRSSSSNSGSRNLNDANSRSFSSSSCPSDSIEFNSNGCRSSLSSPNKNLCLTKHKKHLENCEICRNYENAFKN